MEKVTYDYNARYVDKYANLTERSAQSLAWMIKTAQELQTSGAGKDRERLENALISEYERVLQGAYTDGIARLTFLVKRMSFWTFARIKWSRKYGW